ncbi:hypothetical protein [Candidatus Erwinia haradaeae]|nr:hypothetical protein [Candidatus Erwinia haradaeae]
MQADIDRSILFETYIKYGWGHVFCTVSLQIEDRANQGVKI